MSKRTNSHETISQLQSAKHDRRRHALHALISRNRRLAQVYRLDGALVAIVQGHWTRAWTSIFHGPFDTATGIVCQVFFPGCFTDFRAREGNERFQKLWRGELGEMRLVCAIPKAPPSAPPAFTQLASFSGASSFVELIVAPKRAAGTSPGLWHDFTIREGRPDPGTIRRFVVRASKEKASLIQWAVREYYKTQADRHKAAYMGWELLNLDVQEGLRDSI